jgi:hypothetical protein
VFDRCYTGRFQGYWDASRNMMRSFDTVCDNELYTLVQEPKNMNPAAINMTYDQTTSAGLFDQLQGSCILLFGDSTDRHIVENWCSRWGGREMWSPRNSTDGSLLDSTKLARKIRDDGGWRCSPENKFTIGNLMHYGVAPPPYWMFAHTNLPRLPNYLEWGDTTWERVTLDIPKFFQDCARSSHNNNFVVVQSYLWDLSRQSLVYGTARPPASMISEWAQNATRLIDSVRAATNATVAWRFHGPLKDGNAWDSQAIYDMNLAMQAAHPNLDFVADVHNHGPFDLHPPPLAQTSYLNLLLNAILAFSKGITAIKET